MPADFDLSGVLRRIRRRADLSQRQLAAATGISSAAIARAEAGTHGLPVSSLARAAAAAELRLTLVDPSGAEVGPMSADTVRDHGRRRFPAHLDTRRSDEGRVLHEPRKDRPESSFTYRRHRGDRDARRQTEGMPTDHHPVLPGDSPAGRRAARRAETLRRWHERREQRPSGKAAPPADTAPDCTCPPACDELDDWSGRPVHAEHCPCSCDVG